MVVLTALILLGLTGCKKKEFSLRELDFPSTPPLHSDIKYGVVKTSYLRVVENPGEAGDSIVVLRLGDLVSILSTIKKDDVLWAEVDNAEYVGWAEKSSLEIYRTEPEARTASRILLKE